MDKLKKNVLLGFLFILGHGKKSEYASLRCSFCIFKIILQEFLKYS